MFFIASTLGMESFSPLGSIGIYILLIGLLFSSMIGYIFYISMSEMSLKENKRSIEEKKAKQRKDIARLYPQA